MCRVLVVDDHPVNRMIGHEVFQYLGCAVETAASALEALELLKIGDFDLVCLDRHMPGLGGDDLLTRISPRQFVVAWSTDPANLPERFDGVLSKPISIASASAALVAALTGPRAMPSAPVQRESSHRSFA